VVATLKVSKTERVKVPLALAGWVAESWTAAENVHQPWAVGVPLIAPEADRLRPRGKAPDPSDHA
jgi:hypothetical protein